MATLHIHPGERRNGGSLRRWIDLVTPAEQTSYPTTTAKFDITGGGEHHMPLVDCYLTTAAMIAMRRGHDLHLHGPVSRRALQNAYEFRDAWVKWLPDLFSRVELNVDSIVDTFERPPARTIQAFSGGLDAMFTLWYHQRGGPVHARKGIDRAVFVHGYDIAINDQTGFDASVAKARLVLDAVDVPLTLVRTNLRAVSRLDWEMFHGAAIACVLGHFAPSYTQGLIGSGPSYSALRLPWGSNPVTDALCSGAMMDIFHDGAGYSRAEKIGGVGQWATAAENLRVCWRGADKSVNCGSCEKCVRTALGFMANGLAVPASLNGPVSPQTIRRIGCKDDYQLNQLTGVYRLAKSKGIEAPWRGALWKVITDYRKRAAARINPAPAPDGGVAAQPAAVIYAGAMPEGLDQRGNGTVIAVQVGPGSVPIADPAPSLDAKPAASRAKPDVAEIAPAGPRSRPAGRGRLHASSSGKIVKLAVAAGPLKPRGSRGAPSSSATELHRGA